MLLSLLLTLGILQVGAPPLRRSTFQQYNCIDGHGFGRDGPPDGGLFRFLNCGVQRNLSSEDVIETNDDGEDIRTTETTVRNRYEEVIKIYKLFPGGCKMKILRCNLTEADVCIPGTVRQWKPGYWQSLGEPFACPIVIHPFNITTNGSHNRLTKRAPKGAKCFMKETKNNKNPTPCGSGEEAALLALEDLAKQPADYCEIPMDNEADAILSRGDGEFDWRSIELNQKFVCKKHMNELGRGFKRKLPYIKRNKVQMLKCGMPLLENIKSHSSPTVAQKGRFLNKEEAEAILEVKKVFVQPGIALCSYHKDVAGDIEAEYRVLRKGYNLRDIIPGSLAEAPPTPQALPGYSRIQQQLTCPSIDEQGEDRTYDPDASAAEEYSKQLALESLRQTILELAPAADLDAAAIHFTDNFKILATPTQRKRVQVAKKVVLAVCKGFAPDDPKYFEQLLYGKQDLDTKNADLQAKLDNTVRQVLKCFQNSPTGVSKQQALALIAPFFGLAEIRSYFPDVTPYYFKRARIFSKLYQPGQQLPLPDTKRQRISDKQLAIVVQFITSAPVVMDLPFGTATATTSDGNKEEIPLVVRMQVNERIYRQYVAYLQESDQQDQAVSRSTMLRLLHYCTASTRSSLQGLDYFTWAGGEGFSSLLEITDRLAAYSEDPGWAPAIKNQLKEARQYLKLDYKLHIKEASRIPDHCMTYALSDSENPAFNADVQHLVDMRCERCEALKRVIIDIRSAIDGAPLQTDQQKQEKDELLYEYENAVNAILEMKKHILRTIRQEQARTDILESLDENSVFVVLDWAMKHLPIAGRVPQSEWFGQRGMSWHIAHVTAKNEAGNDYRTRLYVNVFESVAQDSPAVIAILTSIMRLIKQEIPQITHAYLRSDNAGCYKSAQTIAAVPEISARSGILIRRWDFSDPQSGKGACDRAAATIKRQVRLYAAENHRCTNAKEFATCVNSYEGIRSVTIINSEITVQKKTLPKIPGITLYNNFEYRGQASVSDIVVWRAYKIGMGLTLPARSWHGKKLLQDLKIIGNFTHGTEGDLPSDSSYWKSLESPPPAIEDNSMDEAEDIDGDINSEESIRRFMFPCPEPGCIKTYQSHNALLKHMETGLHHYKPEKISLRDEAIGAYKRELEGLRLHNLLPSVQNALEDAMQQTAPGMSDLQRGWALRTRSTCTRFTKAQTDYLASKFDVGAKTGRKMDPKVVSKQMRREFPKAQWLTATQIASYWSRLAHKKRGEPAQDLPECQDDQSGDPVNEEHIADDAYFNTLEDDIHDVIEENQANIFQ